MEKYIRYITLSMIGILGTLSVLYAAINYSEYFPNGSSTLQSLSNGWTTPVSNNTKEIDTPEWCRRVTSTQGTAMFIPTRTLAEWVSFRDHLPSGMSIATCTIAPITGTYIGGGLYCYPDDRIPDQACPSWATLWGNCSPKWWDCYVNVWPGAWGCQQMGVGVLYCQ